jgi:hypothetical protein
MMAHQIMEAINSAMYKLKEEHNARGTVSTYQTVERPSDNGVNMIDFGYLTTEEMQLFIGNSNYYEKYDGYDELYTELIGNGISPHRVLSEMSKQEASTLLKKVKTELRQKHRDVLRQEVVRHHIESVRGKLDDGLLEIEMEKTNEEL